MYRRIIGFGIWALCGLTFFGIGIYAFWAKKAVGFWANAKTVPVKDVKTYNRCMGKLYCGFSIVFIALGLPLLAARQNSPMIIISCIGVMFEVIIMMAVYTKIENKYRQK